MDWPRIEPQLDTIPMENIIGTCSLCGGDVVRKAINLGDSRATCKKCGAKEKRNLPVISMEK